MRLYSRDDEERVRAQAQLRAWRRAGLLDPGRAAALEAEVRPDLKRTNDLLRAGVAAFTIVIVVAAVLLVGIVVNVNVLKPSVVALIAGVAAVACLAGAEFLVSSLRLYRFGVEEALAICSAALFGVAAMAGFSEPGGHHEDAIAGLVACSLAALWIYVRFGFLYAAVAAMAGAALIPFQLDLIDTTQRLMAFAILVLVFVFARTRRLRHQDDFEGDEYATLQAVSMAGLYLTMNLQLTDVTNLLIARAVVGHGWFYWTTYVAIWLIPLVGFRMGIRQRDRELIDVSVLLGLVTLVTNKPYLGWPRHTWDPMLLGLVLMAGTIALRRWLARGSGGARAGFTAARILDTDKHAVTILATASAALRPDLATAPAAPARTGFEGGQSGGGGGGASF